tara:strand:+ start:1601 stop:1840 length:240 start_codon:yes stop_codon:yes gene_type:complete
MKMNKVWIEIERDADKAVNHERAEKFTNLLAKLGSSRQVWFNETKNRYFSGTVDSFRELTDSGDWFNLDALGAPPPTGG